MALRVSLSYYDKVLAAIAASLAGGSLLGAATTYSYRAGLLVGALVATVFVYDAIFRNPPLPDGDARTTYAVVVWHLFLVMLAFPFLR
ncbi:hypothetical protein SY89_00200 [Halolamina pelagica]|uniref:Uncharacterized protein n=1 Tax=Halolamina pelagica TaxID=699431 RepID=A0A0P7GLQ0_9EURY|nr:hypothetical protein [Halolamina pelagica]KPN29487.1 hypothetical protein SY89_00200 [Halolamina pelagica]